MKSRQSLGRNSEPKKKNKHEHSWPAQAETGIKSAKKKAKSAPACRLGERGVGHPELTGPKT